MLYTESLLQTALKTSEALREMLCCDPTTMFAILGVAPVGYLTKVSSSMSGRDDVILNMLSLGASPTKGQKQCLMRIPWTYPASGDSKVVQAKQFRMNPELESKPLTRMLFCMYQKMFAHEILGSLGALVRRQFQTPLSGDLRFYTRASFVMVLALIKSRIRTNWEDLMGMLVHEIMTDTSMPIGSNQLQELLCWLHLTAVWDDPAFFRQPVRDSEVFKLFESFWLRLPIIFQKPAPHVVYIAMAVPRRALSVFRSRPIDQVGTPGLHISVSHSRTGMLNLFFAINGFFGKFRPTTHSPFHCDIEIDDDGWKGNSDLIVTCAVPIYTLMLGNPRDIQICLEINVSPETLYQFGTTLGPFLRIFQTGVQDIRVQILNEPPGFINKPPRFTREPSGLINELSKFQKEPSRVISESPKFTEATPDTATPNILTLNLAFDDFYTAQLNSGGIVRELTQRSSFATGSEVANLLSKGGRVKAFRASPCSFVIQVGDFNQEVFFHYPLFGTLSTIRPARSRSWIELVGSVHSPNQRSGYDPEHFPIIVDNGQVMQWSLSNVDLGKLHRLSPGQDFSWLLLHLSMSFGAGERSMSKSHSESALMRLKQSISIMFQAYSAIHPQRIGQAFRAFLLVNKDEDCDTIIFAKNLLYDPDTTSVVLEAQLVCLTGVRTLEFAPLLARLSEEALTIPILADEELLWKHLLPALVERCRMKDWEHHSSCPYLSGASVPLSTQHGESPICVCGEKQSSFEGIDPLYAPMSKYATRLALAPLAAVPYVEEICVDENLKRAVNQDVQKDPTEDKMSSSAATCDHCGEQPKQLKWYSRCRLAKYCNRACQQAAWKGHKKACQQARRGL